MRNADNRSDMKRYESLAAGIADSIRAGVLRPGDRLPSVRQARASRGVSSSTVFQAPAGGPGARARTAATRPGDAVLIESPTFYAALQALERNGLEAIEVPTHPSEGIELDALARAILRHRPKACWLMTGFQNPLGSLMPDATARRSRKASASRQGRSSRPSALSRTACGSTTGIHGMRAASRRWRHWDASSRPLRGAEARDAPLRRGGCWARACATRCTPPPRPRSRRPARARSPGPCRRAGSRR
jgi:hypothetical protein